ncbi:TatD family hydrolase [Lentiprolixibacter aurantiacus]|uniref:TatD family hydrolase n=1 Tax=Lentiprolixibacter aurantiacus TaxID=2993939 RepID=A0AAE3MJR4_9FLAO|nr:TatD family hydrolase [Lentiprolixibacter aurantiacus]MCX2718985.1 TatD family hydrolase [Lentiprolixibacter aurantiacus]
MVITDTHCHLYLEAFEEDLEAVMSRANAEGVSRFFIPAIDSGYTQAMLDLKGAFPDQVFLMAGLHPTHVKENYRQELEHVKTLLDHGNYCAVGEIGIDLYWDKTFIRQQQEAFRIQIRWAKEYGLPIVIHCRESFDEIFEILEEEKGNDLRGIFHCFTGTLEQAHRAIGYNMKLGIGGVVTFKNGKIDQFIDQIDLEHIVLETDSPYLAPVPYRGKRNESSYLRQVIDKLATLYNIPGEEIARITTVNSRAVFGM